MDWLDGIKAAVAPGWAAADAFLGPSEDAKATFDALKKRWDTLLVWGLFARVPESVSQIVYWEDFRKQWPKGETINGLAAQAANLGVAERMAEAKGFNRPPEDVKAPDVEQVSPAHSAAASVDKGAKAAEETAKEVAADAKDAAVSAQSVIPWYVKGGIAVGIGLVGLSVLSPYLRLIPKRT